MAGGLQEAVGDIPEAMVSYERALRANPQSIPALMAISLVLRSKDDFARAIEYLQACLQIDNKNGEAWGSLGMYCCLVRLNDRLIDCHLADQLFLQATAI